MLNESMLYVLLREYIYTGRHKSYIGELKYATCHTQHKERAYKGGMSCLLFYMPHSHKGETVGIEGVQYKKAQACSSYKAHATK